MARIENKRKELFETALTFGIHAKETLECSRELDFLINKYLQHEQIRKRAVG